MTFNKSEMDRILSTHKAGAPSLVQVLQDTQIVFNYLPREALGVISGALDVPLAKVYSTATFYKAFSLKPRGRTRIKVCLGTACHVRGAGLILDEFERALGIKSGCTTEDLEYSLESVNCVGACAMAPVVVEGEKYHAECASSDVRKIAKQ